jgi:hypothetical protein
MRLQFAAAKVAQHFGIGGQEAIVDPVPVLAVAESLAVLAGSRRERNRPE